MDRDDVRVVQAGQDAGFGQVRLDILRPGDPLRVGDLDGHRAVEVVIMGQIDAPEAALTQEPDHPVTIDLLG